MEISINKKAHFHILTSNLLIAGSFIACKDLADVAHPLSLTLLRFLIATLTLLPIILFKKKYRNEIIRSFPRSIIISFFYVGYFVLMFWALQTTSSLHTGSLSTLVPLITALLSILIFKQKIGLKKFFIYLIGVCGTSWVVFDGNISKILAFHLNDGDMIYLVALFFTSGYIFSTKLLHLKNNSLVQSFCTVTAGVFWLTISILLIGPPLHWEKINTTEHLFSIFYLAIFTTSITAYQIQKAATILTPNSINAYSYLQPCFVLLLDLILYSQIPKLSIWVGVSLSIFATLGLLYSENKTKKIKNQPSNESPHL